MTPTDELAIKVILATVMKTLIPALPTNTVPVPIVVLPTVLTNPRELVFNVALTVVLPRYKLEIDNLALDVEFPTERAVVLI